MQFTSEAAASAASREMDGLVCLRFFEALISAIYFQNKYVHFHVMIISGPGWQKYSSAVCTQGMTCILVALLYL